MHTFIKAFSVLRAPILVALLAVAIIILPSQSLEIFHAIRESSGLVLLTETVRLLIFTGLLSAALLLSCLVLITAATDVRKPAVDRYRGLLEALAFGLALMPIISILMVNIVPRSLHVQHPRWDALLKLIFCVPVVGVVGLLVYFDTIRRTLVSGALTVSRRLMGLSAVNGLLLICSVIAGLIAVIVIYPRQLADVLGPVSVTFLFFTILCVATSLLTFIYDRYEIPAIAILLIAGLTWSLNGINNNHAIRIASNSAPELPEAVEEFKAWLRNRPDLRDFDGRPYPVYLVAAEGGGLYAAVHAAATLARVQDNCPAFAQHLFAISAVSGGSLGSAVFAGLVKALPPERNLPPERRCSHGAPQPGPLQDAVRAYFKEDLLTPLVAAGLFPDFVQRFWPIPIETFDRARALEQGYEESWKKIMQGIGRAEFARLFSEDSRKLWDTMRDTPALLLNATVVQTGDRAVIAPFKLSDPYWFIDLSVDILNARAAIRLSSAVGASARFPAVTPPALVGSGRRARQLVDGGYFENSGIQTVVNLMEKIISGSGPPRPATVAPFGAGDCAGRNTAIIDAESSRPLSVCFKIIVLRSTGGPRHLPLTGEIVSPILALYEARGAKGRSSAQYALNAYCGGKECGFGRLAVSPHVYASYIPRNDFSLGWYFSSASLDKITRGRTPALDCAAAMVSKPPDQTGGGTRAPASPAVSELLEEESACLVWRVAQDLNRS